jgi:hypothetical protein
MSLKACWPVHDPVAIGAEVLRGNRRVVAAQRSGQMAPLAGAVARAMKALSHPRAPRPRGYTTVTFMGVVPLRLAIFLWDAAGHYVTCSLAHDRKLDLDAR